MASRFHTGGLGVMHGDGCIELKDRAKDIIISGGENISTIEVEGVLYKHPAVLEAAVVARLDEKWGETPCAFLTLKAGKSATEGEIIAFCRGNLAHYKCLRPVIYCDLPKTSTGKVRRPARCRNSSCPRRPGIRKSCRLFPGREQRAPLCRGPIPWLPCGASCGCAAFFMIKS